ncbi:MAG: cell division protein FtsQ/DivIB [Saprospiraceae bacterium]|nr:cell division protein FtsQ/DivIB [Lewinella sp.]
MMQQKHIRQLKTLGYLAAGLLGILLIISAVERKGENRVVDVVVDIEPLPDSSLLIKREDVLLAIDRSFGYPLNALPVREVNMERLERILEEDPFVLDAETYINAKSKIFIHIEQREPILRVIDNNGLNYFLDRTGVRMKPSQHASPHVIVLTGNIPPYSDDFLEPDKDHLLKDLFELTELIRKDELLNPMIEQIHVTNRNEVTLVPKIGQQKIFFGRIRESEEKLERLKIFYREAAPYEGWRKYRSLDLRYEGQVVAKR